MCEDEGVLGQGWQSQWERVQRRLKDVRAVYSGRQGDTNDAIDSVLSFFEAAHHMKDWLRNDPASGITKADVNSLLRASQMLQLTGDLANGSKHLKLTTTHTGDKTTQIARNDVTIFAGTGTAAHRFFVQSGGTEHDVIDIAESTVAEWTRFLTTRGLL